MELLGPRHHRIVRITTLIATRRAGRRENEAVPDGSSTCSLLRPAFPAAVTRKTLQLITPLLLCASSLWAQDTSSGVVASDSVPLAARAQWPGDSYVGSRAALAFELSRPLGSGERFALIIGSTDVSAAVHVRDRRAEYEPAALRLPPGETEAVAYIVSAEGTWSEIGRAPLRVRTRSGFDRTTTSPSADLSSSGQLNQYVAAGDPPPDRKAYQDLTLRLGLSNTLARDGWDIGFTSNAIGVTQETQRLRYGEQQSEAAPIDLADYRLQVSRGPVKIALGNVAVGANRYLLSGYGSRGATAALQLNRAVSIEASAVNGTNVVGWDNMLGVSESDHRLISTSVNLEVLPSRPGALHVDLSALDGSLMPRSGFTQGAVTDAERSRGFGVQFGMSDPKQWVRLTGGVTQSRFRNPSDVLLNGDTSVVAVRTESRQARYGELGVQLLRDVRVFDSTRASVSATVRHERVDPLYRSVGAYVQGDMQQDGGDLMATIGALAVQGTLTHGRDNLAGIPSILTTRTRRRALSFAAPLSGLLGLAPRSWLPVATFAWEGTGQEGEGIPTNSDFSATHVPNQFNRVRSASVTWSPARLNVSYRWNESLQDNRQIGRDRADFLATVHAVSLGLNGIPRLTPSLEGSVERQDNMEAGTQQRTSRIGTIVQAQISNSLAFSGNLAHTWSFDPFADRRSRNLELQGELSQGFTLYRRVDGGTQGRVFVRYARTRAAFFPLIPDPSVIPQLMWTINAGSSFRLF